MSHRKKPRITVQRDEKGVTISGTPEDIIKGFEEATAALAAGGLYACPTCGENVTRYGRRCPRCERNLEEDRLERESGR